MIRKMVIMIMIVIMMIIKIITIMVIIIVMTVTIIIISMTNTMIIIIIVMILMILMIIMNMVIRRPIVGHQACWTICSSVATVLHPLTPNGTPFEPPSLLRYAFARSFLLWA